MFPISRWTLVVASFAIALGGCGGSVCDRAQSVFNSLQNKGNACSFGDAGVSTIAPGVPLIGSSFNKQTCETKIKQCSSSDKDQLNRALDCLDRTPTCARGAEVQYLFGVLSCVPSWQRITPSCVQAISQP